MMMTMCWMGEPGMGDTVLTGTAGDGPTAIIEPPQPMSPAKIHAPAAATIASDTPMHSRRPTRGVSALSGLECALAISPERPHESGARIRPVSLHPSDSSHSITFLLHSFGARRQLLSSCILVTSGGSTRKTVRSNPQRLTVRSEFLSGRGETPARPVGLRRRLSAWAVSGGLCRNGTAQNRSTACPSRTRLAIPPDAPYYPH